MILDHDPSLSCFKKEEDVVWTRWIEMESNKIEIANFALDSCLLEKRILDPRKKNNTTLITPKIRQLFAQRSHPFSKSIQCPKSGEVSACVWLQIAIERHATK